MLTGLALVTAILLGSTVAASAQGDGPPPDEVAARLVQSIAEKPAIYSQICAAMMRDASLGITASFAGATSATEHHISSEQYAKLRAMREPAIRALNFWLANEGSWAELGKVATGELARRKLGMLVELNATSSLPHLKKVAERLSRLHAQASPETTVDWPRVEKLEDAKKKSIYAKAAIGDILGDVLSAILAILRQEKFEPLRSSRLEGETQAAIAEDWKKPWRAELAERIRENKGEIPEKDRPHVSRDPITGAPVLIWQYPKLKLSAEDVAEILSWVDAYGQLPPDRRLDVKGMSAWPLNR